MMKKIVIVVILLFNINAFATSGSINEKSIFECNGKYYGSHGDPIHFHEVVKKDNKWVINGGEVEIPSCYIKPINEREEVAFSKCVDGDTAKFIVNGKEETVRFLAIDTPEIKHGDVEEDPFGNESSNYTCKKLKNAKKIILEYDSNSSKTDKYGRLLAFVFVDDLFLQKELISKGLAKVYYIYGDYNYVDELRKEESVAKKNKLGIWRDDIDEQNIPDVLSEGKEEKKEETLNEIIKYLKIIWEFLVKIFDLLFD